MMNDSRFHAVRYTTGRILSGAPVETVEIADDEDLLERYGVRIPVLRHRETGGELDWPFDAAAVRRLVLSES